MKQVTGNKTTRDSALASILSIRLSPDGFYFRVIRRGKIVESGSFAFEKRQTVSGLAGYIKDNELFGWKFLKVILNIDTYRAVLFPVNENIEPGDLLQESDIPVFEQECTVVSENVNGIKAVMAVDSGNYALIEGIFESMEVVHPLLGLTGSAAKRTLRVYTSPGNLYLALISDKKLTRIEAAPYRNMEDTSYFIGSLLSYSGRRTRVRLFGKYNSGFGGQIEKRFSAKQKPESVPEWLW